MEMSRMEDMKTGEGCGGWVKRKERICCRRAVVGVGALETRRAAMMVVCGKGGGATLTRQIRAYAPSVA